MYGTTIYGMIRNGIVWNVIALIATPKNPRFFVIRKTDDNCDLCWGPLRPRAVRPVPHPPNIVEF